MNLKSQAIESYYIHGYPMLKNALHIIRWKNLLILGGIQYLIYHNLLDHASSVLSIADLVLIILVTICLAAGGYVINDYYDSTIDSLNKPKRWVAGNLWTLKQTKQFYLMIVFIGFIIALWTAIRLDLIKYIFIYPAAVAGLWIYSYALKCKPVIGNVWVSFFCAGVVGIVALPDLIYGNTDQIKVELWYYMVFAFLATWFREIVKDIEDVVGDGKSNCQTAVVRFGLNTGKYMAIFFGILLVIALLFWDKQQTNNWVKLTLTVLQGFTVGAMAFVWWAKNNEYYHHASTIIKLVMVGGTIMLIWI